jgi:uncharacterized cupredoxin-like copper-binding protein
MRKRTLVLNGLVAVLALVLAACGGDDDDADAHGESDSATTAGAGVTRTVDITMVDIAYQPTELRVQTGETVRFVFRNEGAAQHDAFLGDAAAQADHAREMRIATSDSHPSGPGTMSEHGMADTAMDHGSGEAGINVAPGETGEITYTFDQPGSLEIGCHEPGHYEAGMKIAVTVV